MSKGNSFAALEDLKEALLESHGDERKMADESRKQGRSSNTAEASASGAGLDSDKPAPKYKLKNPIVWMDLEMTGLDPDVHHILEIAVLITDGELTAPHLEGPELVIHQSEQVLQGMNEWCVENHGKSGLTERSRESTVSLADAENQVLEFLRQHTQSMEEPGPAEFKAQLAGNSIYVDRMFLQKHMPRVHAHLHWRLIDVSTVLELCRRWYPSDFKHAPRKKGLHTAMSDIRESLVELKYYRRSIFKPPSNQPATPASSGRHRSRR